MFSELVDRAVHSTGRPDNLDNIAYWMNVTMRDISKREDFPEDSVEESITIPQNSASFVWTPEVGRSRFRREDILEDACGCIGFATKPGRRMSRDGTFRYYHSGGSLVLVNACSPVFAYYYAYQPWLVYFPKGSRPTEWNVELGEWSEPEPAAVALVSNWLLERHSETVLSGTLAKFFATKQDPRQQVHYSAYEQGVSHIIRGESVLELLQREQ